MLRNLKWLDSGQPFPPLKERDRIRRYIENEALFDGEHFGDVLRTRDNVYMNEGGICVYQQCAERISKVIGNFEDVISFPVLLNYQRLMSMKMADLVCGEYPTITGANSKENQAIKDCRDYTEFDSKAYSTVIDISRYGDAIWRIYLDDSGRKTFTCWDPKEWYPIVSQDGTNTITAHVLCWRVNLTESATDLPPEWELHCQIHWATGPDVGTYEYRIYDLNGEGTAIIRLKHSEVVNTGLDSCAVIHNKCFSTTSSVYGYDDYMPVDSILAEIMTRIGQISVILDKHADPNITGPVSMLTMNPTTGERYLAPGKFFAISIGEQEPKYMTWDGQLTAAFEQLEFLINQLYILSEMGAALLGGQGDSGDAISGAAMRFKMVNPLAKARRIANSMSLSVCKLFSELSSDAEVEEDDSDDSSTLTQSIEDSGMYSSGDGPQNPVRGMEYKKEKEELVLPIPVRNISVFWSDGLPDDPRENIENCKLATGATKMMPLETGIMEYFGRTNEEAQQWLRKIDEETTQNMLLQTALTPQPDAETDDPNKPGPNNPTGVNPQKKGSTTGLNNFASRTNKKSED